MKSIALATLEIIFLCWCADQAMLIIKICRIGWSPFIIYISFFGMSIADRIGFRNFETRVVFGKMVSAKLIWGGVVEI